MSKHTTITCDGCGASQTGIGYATLWPKLKRMGWTADNTRHVHFCKKCAALRQAQGEEILSLRAEVARLKDEVASLEQELKFSDETEYELIKKLFDLKICHKETICEQADAQELNFEGESGCLFCWRQWAIMKARENPGNSEENRKDETA